MLISRSDDTEPTFASWDASFEHLGGSLIVSLSVFNQHNLRRIMRSLRLSIGFELVSLFDMLAQPATNVIHVSALGPAATIK